MIHSSGRLLCEILLHQNFVCRELVAERGLLSETAACFGTWENVPVAQLMYTLHQFAKKTSYSFSDSEFGVPSEMFPF